MVERGLPKPETRVRFPSPAPFSITARNEPPVPPTPARGRRASSRSRQPCRKHVRQALVPFLAPHLGFRPNQLRLQSRDPAQVDRPQDCFRPRPIHRFRTRNPAGCRPCHPFPSRASRQAQEGEANQRPSREGIALGDCLQLETTLTTSSPRTAALCCLTGALPSPSPPQICRVGDQSRI